MSDRIDDVNNWRLAVGTSREIVTAAPPGSLSFADEVATMAHTGPDARERAEFIVRACKSHGPLLGACEAVLHRLDYLQLLWGKEGITDGLAGKLREAVAMAKGEKGGETR